jgi:hypothetical protein
LASPEFGNYGLLQQHQYDEMVVLQGLTVELAAAQEIFDDHSCMRRS